MSVLTRVQRFDSMPLNATYFTAEGYLVDHPILTTCGIFEYTNNDGSTRKELRLPEEVFAKSSLESYKGKPIIITHNAGVVDKNNVADEQIGTILGYGYKDGKDVRAEIIIHNTEELKASGLRALSLGYNLELDETPGEWHGEHYDAIQRNIEINHLALVAEARAGDNARLNIDGKDKKTIGGETMKKRRNADGEAMDPVVLEEAINAFKARKEKQKNEADKKDAAKKKIGFFARRKKDGEFKPMDDKAKAVPEEVVEKRSFEERVDSVKKRRDKRDEMDEPSDARAALGVIAEQDEDIDELLKIIEEMGAEKAENKDEDDVEEETVDEVEFEEDEDEVEDEETFEDEVEDEEPDDEEPEEDFEEDEDDEEEVEESEEDKFYEDEDEEEEEDFEDEDFEEEEVERKDKKHCDNDRSLSKNLNLDSIDKYIARKIDVCRTGDLLNLRGLEKMKLMDARKAVVKRVNPGIRLDGKSDSYINGLYQSARSQAMKTRRTDRQRQAIFNHDGVEMTNKTSAEMAREKMIKNMKGDK